MKKTHLDKLIVALVAATSIGARGIACGPCPDYDTTVPVLLPSSDGGVEDAGDWVTEECQRQCPNAHSCEATTIGTENGPVPALHCVESADCSAGRRPMGYEAATSEATSDPIAGWLSRASALEAASVVAFRDLRRDLARLGAPRRLLRSASRAARDEMRHARATRSLARKYGARGVEPILGHAKPITLEELAAHNASEGCVREAFGALVARWQATFAEDREVRSAMARIAEEEAEHAALAFAIDAWAMQRLGKAARARVEAARARALAELACVGTNDRARTPKGRALGLPEGEALGSLARGFSSALQARAAA